MKNKYDWLVGLLLLFGFLFVIYSLSYSPEADAREVTPQLHTNMAWTGQPLLQTIHIDHVEMKKGEMFDWHENRQTTCAIILDGEVEIQILDGETAIFRRDDAFCAPIGVSYRTQANQYTIYKRIAIYP